MTEPAAPGGPPAGHLVADQREVAAFLSQPATHGGQAVERIDTHASMVFLAGDLAYKVKRAVAFPYMDFSTLERRRAFCEKEILLNRRTAPDLYLRAMAIRRGPAGGLSLGGAGEVVEWAVVMRRFDQDSLFDRLAAAGRLTDSLLRDLADAVAGFHQAAEPVFEGAGDPAWVIDENAQEFPEFPALFRAEEAARLTRESRAALARVAPLLARRRAAGLVRRCHGDLHLRNICLHQGRPTPFDAIEFNDRIACIDVVYDLAFLLMDLDLRGHRAGANLVLNRYLARRDGPEALAALPLFLSLRAAVRAKVSASAADSQPDRAARERAEAEARGYFDAALTYLAPPPARLVAVGGLSGSGKSTLARALAPEVGAAPGALHLRSDLLRKVLLEVEELDVLPEAAYRPEVNAEVYGLMLSRAREALAAGHAVVLDAVYARPEERAAAEALAREAGVGFAGLWLEAPGDTLQSRVAARTGDASDATPAVVAGQLALDTGEIAWRRIDAGGPPAAVAAQARGVVCEDQDSPKPTRSL